MMFVCFNDRIKHFGTLLSSNEVPKDEPKAVVQFCEEILCGPKNMDLCHERGGPKAQNSSPSDQKEVTDNIYFLLEFLYY